jgi:hypothetical protein
MTLGATFRLEIRSLHDGHTQRLNATTLGQWGYASAYFPGDAVEARRGLGRIVASGHRSPAPYQIC